MAVRARPDNLALDHPAAEVGDAPVEFAEIWRHRDDLQAICRRVVGDDKADDLVQETFLRALQAERLERRASFAPWLATVARRRSIDRLRADSRALLVESPPERSAGGDPLDHVLHQERTARVRAALATLAPRERRLLMRQVAHDLSLAELAAEEETSIASVRSVLSRARSKLRGSIERGGPLGAAPLPRLAAAVKRRLHQWGARLDTGAPMLAGAGAQLGDVVAAAIAAIAVLLSANVPAPSAPTTVSLVSADQPGASAPAGSHDEHRPKPNGNPPGRHGGGHQGRASSNDSHDSLHPVQGPPVDPPDIELPTVPPDGADQPEEAFLEHIAASDDGRTLLVTGNKDPRAQSLGGQAVYRSDDGGHTWQRLEQADGLSTRYAVLPPGFGRHGTFFLVADPAVLRSDDGGQTFEVIGSSRNGVTTLPAEPDDRRIFLAPAGLVAYDAGTRRTTPYPATPTALRLGGLAVPGAGRAGPSFVVGSALYTTTGAVRGYVQRCTVHACEAPVMLPDAPSAAKVFTSASTPGLVLAAAERLLYRSVDGGATFHKVALPLTGTIHTVVEGTAGELLLARGNSRDSSSSGLLRSVDGGLTWSPLAVGTPLQQGAEGLVYLPTGRIVAGTDTTPGFRCSVDGGLTWQPRCPA